jgi:hypothetical protein
VLWSPIASATQSATITEFSYVGGASINVGVAIPRSVDDRARVHNQNWELDVTVTYVDANGAIQTLDSEPLSIATQTVFIQHLDSNTDLIQVTLDFGSLTLPGRALLAQRR